MLGRLRRWLLHALGMRETRVPNGLPVIVNTTPGAPVHIHIESPPVCGKD